MRRFALAFALMLAWLPAAALTANVVTVSGTAVKVNGTTTQIWGIRAANALWDDPDVTDASPWGAGSENAMATVDDLIAHLPYLKAHGVNMVGFNLQGGRTGTVGSGCVNEQFNAFDTGTNVLSALGEAKLLRLLDAIEAQGMLYKIQLFYDGAPSLGPAADYKTAMAYVANLLVNGGYWNGVVDPANECDSSTYAFESGTGSFTCEQMCTQWKVTDTANRIPCGFSQSADPATVGANDDLMFRHDAATNDQSCEDTGVDQAKPCIMDEMQRSDQYNAGTTDGRGVFSSGDRTATATAITTSLANGTGFFVHSTWHQMTKDSTNSCAVVGPRWTFGGVGTSASPGVHWAYDLIRDAAGLGEHYNVSWASGTDAVACGSDDATACKTVSRLLTEQTLSPGSIVDLAAGTYRDSFTIGTSDDGSAAGDVTFRCQTGTCLYTSLSTTTPTFTDCTTGCSITAPHVYVASVATAPIGVTETTNWQNFSMWDCNSGSCSGTVEANKLKGAEWYVTEPWMYTQRSSQAEVAGLACSYYYDGGAQKLYVRPCRSQPASPVTPASVGVETTSANSIVTSASATYVTLDGIDFAYAAYAGINLELAPGHHWTVKNSAMHSFAKFGIIAKNTSYLTVKNVTVKTAWKRGDITPGFDLNTDGDLDQEDAWQSGASGYGITIGLSNNVLIEDVDVAVGWNCLSIEDSKDWIVRRAAVHDTANHTIITLGLGGKCDRGKIEYTASWNGQDSLYDKGCSHVEVYRSFVKPDFLDGGGVRDNTPYGKVRSSIIPTIAVESSETSTFSSDYNAYLSIPGHSQNNSQCTFGSFSDPCDATWFSTCGCDPNHISATSYAFGNGSVYVPPNTTWIHAQGLQYSLLTLADFEPAANSPLINAGDPDIDGDGTIERPTCVAGPRGGKACDVNGDCPSSTCNTTTYPCPGSADCCTVANSCNGRQPDIGPVEYSLDTVSAYCGDGIVNGSETCDDGVNDVCAYGDTAPYEQRCDNVTCTTTANCTAPTYCGDGVKNGPEACDTTGPALDGQTCATRGFPSGGTLGCTAGCLTFDTSGCSSTLAAQCDDNLDNDGDGYTDYDGNGGQPDIGCTDANDNTEARPTGTSWIIPYCTEAAIVQALDDMCDAGGNISWAMDESCAGQTLVWDTTAYPAVLREIRVGCNGNSIDFNAMKFQPVEADNWIASDTRCSTCETNPSPETCAAPCDTSSPKNGIPERCPANAAEKIPRFLMIRGDNNNVSNFHAIKWGEAIAFDARAGSQANGNTVDNWSCIYPGDDCVGNEEGSTSEWPAYGNTVSNAAWTNVCDKAVMAHGRDGVSYPPNNPPGQPVDERWQSSTDYDLTLTNIRCTNANGCVRSNSGGYANVVNMVVTETVAESPLFNCNYGFRYDGSAGSAKVTGGSITGCSDGMIVGPNADLFVDGMTFSGISGAGLRVDSGTGNVVVQNSTFGTGTAIKVLSGSTGTVDAGNGGTITLPGIGQLLGGSVGVNNFCAATLGVDNRDDGTVKAINNTWDDADPTDELSNTGGGGVDWFPLYGTCAVATPVPGARTIGTTVRGGTVR